MNTRRQWRKLMEPSGPGEFKCTEKAQLSAAMTYFFIIVRKKEKFVEKTIIRVLF